jgi:hypothetical protein
MMNHGIDFTLVVDQATFDKQEEIFIKCHETICESTKVNTEFEIIVADEDSVGLKMIRLLKKQKNVLLYIDGNTGVGGAENTSKMESIKFLNKDIFSRKGIAALSYITDVPIFPTMKMIQSTLSFLIN